MSKQSAPSGDQRHFQLAQASLCLSTFAFALSTTLLLPSIPAIQMKYETSGTAAAWVITAYMLVGAVSNPILGRLGDLHGQRRVLLGVLTLFMVGGVVAVVAPSIGVVIAARAAQGAAGAALPLSFGILRRIVPEARRSFAISLMGSMTALGAGVGMPLGGLLAQSGSVTPIFTLGTILGACAFISTCMFVPGLPPIGVGRIDWFGAGLLAVGVTGPLLAVTISQRIGWGHWMTLTALLVGVAALAFWWRFERTTASPLIDLGVLKLRTVATTNLTTFVLAMGLFAGFSLIPLTAQLPRAAGGLGGSSGLAGLLMLPTAVGTFVGAAAAGALMNRLGARFCLLAGAAIAMLGLGHLAFAQLSVFHVAVAAGCAGIGFGTLNASSPNLIVNAVRPEQTGGQTGVTQMVQNIGTSCGSQLTIVTLAFTAVDGVATAHGMAVASTACALAIGIGGVASRSIPSERNRRSAIDVHTDPTMTMNVSTDRVS